MRLQRHSFEFTVTRVCNMTLCLHTGINYERLNRSFTWLPPASTSCKFAAPILLFYIISAV